jgi:hypothetical protein
MESLGLILPGCHSFRAIIEPLDGLTNCFWLIDSQQPLFRSHWRYGSPENEARCEKQWFDVLACRNSSSSCWRPHTFPPLAKQVVVEESTYFFAMLCGEEEVPKRVEWIVQHIGDFTGEFFSRLGQEADLFLFHGDGWWELYTHHLVWQRKSSEAFSKSYKRSSRKAGRSPATR